MAFLYYRDEDNCYFPNHSELQKYRILPKSLLHPMHNTRSVSYTHLITNFDMESSALAGLARVMGHKAMTVCMVIANRLIKEANTGYKNSIDCLIEKVLERI